MFFNLSAIELIPCLINLRPTILTPRVYGILSIGNPSVLAIPFTAKLVPKSFQFSAYPAEALRVSVAAFMALLVKEVPFSMSHTPRFL